MTKFWMTASIVSFCVASGIAQSLSGTISDSDCGAKHAAATAADAACVQRCIKRGGAPVLVSDGKVYHISPQTREKVKDVLGQKVTIDGKVEGDTVSIESVELAN